MADRKAEMERKKAKLLALRLEQQRRREAREQQEMAEAAARCSASIREGGTIGTDEDLDALLSSLGVPPGDGTLSGGHVSASSQIRDISTSTHVTIRQGSDHSCATEAPTKKREPVLSVQMQSSVNYVPQELISYSKHTQTTAVAEECDCLPESDVSSTNSLREDVEPIQDIEGQASHESYVPESVTASVDLAKARTSSELPKQVTKDLSVKEQTAILESKEFLEFFNRSSRIVERSLGEKTDIFKDYTKDVTHMTDDSYCRTKPLISFSRTFCYNSLPSVVTSLDWSTQHAELLLASYSIEDLPSKVDEGLCVVWNIMYKTETPEYSFKCSSKVTANKFAVFHPNLLLGGTYSGQIVLWDTRSPRRTPVLQSHLWLGSHTQPISTLSIIGSKNSHNLVSMSADSKVCVWSLDMLSYPHQAIELSAKGGPIVAPTCADFPPNEINNFVVGGEEGSIYFASLHKDSPGITHRFSGHDAPVSGISAISVDDGTSPCNFYLTSSFDWSVKLWSAKGTEPLYTFSDYGDAVYDVQWCPTHPAVFATVDGDGRLQLWNLVGRGVGYDEGPVATVQVESSPALNKVAWSKTGRQVAAGDDHGTVWVYDVNEKLASPTESELSAVLKVLDAKQAQAQHLDGISKGIAKLETYVKEAKYLTR